MANRLKHLLGAMGAISAPVPKHNGFKGVEGPKPTEEIDAQDIRESIRKDLGARGVSVSEIEMYADHVIKHWENDEIQVGYINTPRGLTIGHRLGGDVTLEDIFGCSVLTAMFLEMARSMIQGIDNPQDFDFGPGSFDGKFN